MPDLMVDEVPVHNPADTEQWIREVKDRIARGVRVVTDREKEMKARKRDLDLAIALVIDENEGPEFRVKAKATIQTMPHRKRADDAEIDYKFAVRTAEALNRELFAAMGVNKNVLAMWTAAGVGS